MKKIRPYLWRGGALVLAAALVVLLVLSGMGLSTQEPEPLPQPPAQTIRTEGQGGTSQQEKPNAPEQPENPGVKTGDAGVLLYAGLMLLTLTGSAWVLGRKRTR